MQTAYRKQAFLPSQASVREGWTQQTISTRCFDLLVVNVADLVSPKEKRAETLKRMYAIALRSQSQSRVARGGPWLLLVTHTDAESAAAHALERELNTSTSVFRGTRSITEKNREETARAVLEFHRLHFPFLRDQDRSRHIFIIGRSRKRIPVH